MKKKWYAAHILMVSKRKTGRQRKYVVMENIVLISAKSSDEAWEKAEKRGKEYEQDVITYDGKPARSEFGGVRKIIECLDSEDRPADGTELTYSYLYVDGKVELSKLIEGEPAKISYDE